VTNQICYNLLWRCGELSGLMQMCQENGISVLAWSPLQQGLLTGKFASADDVPGGRARTRLFSRARPFQRHDEEGQEAEAFAAIAALKDAVAEHNALAAQQPAFSGAVTRDAGVTLATASLAWALRHPAVACVLVGCRDAAQVHCARSFKASFCARERLAQVESNAASAAWSLPPSLHESFSRLTLPLAHKLGAANLDPYEGTSHSRMR
jgi:aryl-alcohol dehydrogenase-like predicted oxidoreductase